MGVGGWGLGVRTDQTDWSDRTDRTQHLTLDAQRPTPEGEENDVLKERVDQLRAVEALRAGVPNRDVVRQLPPLQEEIEDRFQRLLEATDAGWMEEKQAQGLLLEGDFGTGKSHWLEYFQHVALHNNFVCSTVVINKETPLYDLAKVVRACAQAAVAPGRTGPAIAELTATYQADKAPGYRDLFEWVHQNKEIDPRFAATLFLFERNPDPELRKRIVDEWTGDPCGFPI